MSPPIPVRIIGALNITPDSFYDGGRFEDPQAAVDHAGQMLADGADIIDIGGESTGPHSPTVPEEEELRRVLPVIDAIRRKFPDALLSIDTYKSAVAKAAIERGVRMVNDVTAGRSDPRMFSTVASSGASMILMYAKDPTPRTTVEERRYDDVIATIREFLRERKQSAIDAGILPDRIILDPGLGHFVSSDPRCSLEILARLAELADLGCPFLVSPSRKSFLAGSENLTTADRLPGTVAASAIAVLHGASYIRTHDVLEVRRGCEIAMWIQTFLR
ncbi:MAG: dihydropteroate synthase [Candidatus Peregrinibacteria bacterium Greene0416_19]|nr:MAG: dihydropteroate synthase [Candidatus Peregrinibacteria bacterium Greene0416_19]